MGNFVLCWWGMADRRECSPMKRSFHRAANRREGCTMVPFSKSKRKFRITGFWLNYGNSVGAPLVSIHPCFRNRRRTIPMQHRISALLACLLFCVPAVTQDHPANSQARSQRL
jgi:hypothetical protein